MAKIYCIVGKSCSGKDTVVKHILALRTDITPIITYTTRPKRVNEKNAKEYYFVDKSTYNKLVHSKKVIEHRKYNTEQGEWIYFTVNDGQIDINSNKKYLIINTLQGAKKLKDIYGENNVIVIHITVKDSTRIMRALGREINGANNYVEMCRRFVSDSNDFSPDMFNKLNLREISIENEDINECINEVNKIIC